MVTDITSISSDGLGAQLSHDLGGKQIVGEPRRFFLGVWHQRCLVAQLM